MDLAKGAQGGAVIAGIVVLEEFEQARHERSRLGAQRSEAFEGPGEKRKVGAREKSAEGIEGAIGLEVELEQGEGGLSTAEVGTSLQELEQVRFRLPARGAGDSEEMGGVTAQGEGVAAEKFSEGGHGGSQGVGE